MKKPVLAFLAVLTLFSFTQSMAQTLPVENPAAASVSDATAKFLATLSGGQPQISDDQMPAPLFMTGCSSRCARGEICCYLCGNPPEGDDSGCWGCVTPVKGGCPQVY